MPLAFLAASTNGFDVLSGHSQTPLAFLAALTNACGVLGGLAREQVGFDEVVDVSTKHGLNVTSFQFGACVLH